MQAKKTCIKVDTRFLLKGKENEIIVLKFKIVIYYYSN